MTPKKFGQALKRLIWSKDGVTILDKYDLQTWTAGGCNELSRALVKHFRDPRAVRRAIVDSAKKPPLDRLAQHYVVKIADFYFDGDGMSAEDQLLDRWRVTEGLLSPRLIHERDAIESGDEFTGTECALEAVPELLALFKKHKLPVHPWDD